MNYNQLGLGLETLGELLDFRINGYLPLENNVSQPWNTTFNTFLGNSMLISQKYQFALKGADAELGFHFGKWSAFDFYAALGPYYYTGYLDPNVWGGKARIAAKYKDILTFEISDSYDGTFHNKFQGQISLNLPFGPKSKVKKNKNPCKLSNVLTSRMVQPVGRQEIIVADTKNKISTAIDPTTGLPYTFIFVNNTSHSNGTFDSPYHTLAQAEVNSGPNDIIYVFPGDGKTTGMNEGIILQASQKFWGSGLSHSLQTTQGNIAIPAQSSSSPTITNPLGDVVTLATNNEVSGFTIPFANNYAIVGIDPQNIAISSCTIEYSQADQIHLEYASSTGDIALTNLTLTGGIISQIAITSTTTDPMTLAIDSCTFERSNVFPVDLSSSNDLSISVTNNQFLNNNNGLALTLNGASTLAISNNTFQGQISESEVPIAIAPGASPFSATIENNLFNNNYCGSISIVYGGNASSEITFINNTFTKNQTGGSFGSTKSNIVLDPNNNTISNCTLNLIGNSFSDNTSCSLITLDNGTFTNFQTTASGNTMTNNGDTALNFASTCPNFTLNATNNTISGLSDNGISTTGNTPFQTANITISNNTITNITGSSSSAINISQGGSTFNFTAEDNTINQCDISGIVFYSNNLFTNMTVNITGNSISNCTNNGSYNAASGISLDTFVNLSATIANNTFSIDAIAPVAIGYNTSPPPNPTVCLTLTGNTTDIDLSNTSYLIYNPGPGSFKLSPCNVSSVNTGTVDTTSSPNPITFVQSCPDGTPCP